MADDGGGQQTSLDEAEGEAGCGVEVTVMERKKGR